MGFFTGTVDKLLFSVTMFVALFLYSGSVGNRTQKWRIPIFGICVVGILGLSVLLEYLRTLISDTSVFINIYICLIDIWLIVVCVSCMLIIKCFTFRSILFIGCASYATVCGANYIYSLISFYCFIDPFDGGIGATELVFRAIIFIVVYALIYTVCWFAFAKKYRKGFEYAINKGIYILFVLILIINLFMGTHSEHETIFNMMMFGRVVVCALILYVQFAMSNHLITQTENTNLKYLLEEQKTQYEIAKDSIERLNIKAHDIKHLINAVKSAAGGGGVDVSELEDIVTYYDNMFNSGNKALDITLTEKSKHYAENGIIFSVVADGEALAFMSDTDIYALFGNILDNAKEAVLKIDDTSNRIISLNIKHSDNFVSVHVENTYAVKPVFASDGLPRTDKNDITEHGFGTKSIKLIAEKYGSILKMSCDGDMFVIDLLFVVR